MVDEGSKRNGCDVLVMGAMSEAENGFVPGLDNGLQTYKRRKCSKTSSSETKCIENRQASVNSASSLSDKTTKEPLYDLGFNNSSCNQDSVAGMDLHDFVNGSDDSSVKHWRKIVLEQMYHSLIGSEDGLKQCIRDALEFHPQSICTTAVRESVCFGKGLQKCTSKIELMSNGAHNTAKGHENTMSNGSLKESNEQTNTGLCKRAFFDILTSENFRKLCNLLFENFGGMRVDRIFDFSSINARMKEGAYESSPVNFHSDIQQVWTKLEKIGTEMAALAKNLSEKSRTSCCKQVGCLIPSTSKDGKNEIVTQEPDVDCRLEQTEACAVYQPCTCKHCGEKAEWKDCLVCDSCEEMYHIYCTNIPIEQIPPATWYCTTCTDNGALSLHENCVLCEKLHSPGIRIVNEKEAFLSSKAEEYDWPEEQSTAWCHICRTDVKDGEDFRICTNRTCPHSRYHVKCLTSKQLNSYGPRWYCPACLCRACLCDRDDEKIILCDACDNAYHIYCLDPPQDTIPTGQWFCKKCDAGVKRIREAREAYEKKLIKEYKERVPSKVVKKQGHKERVPSKVLKKRKRESGVFENGMFEKPWWIKSKNPYKNLETRPKKKRQVKKGVTYNCVETPFKPVEEKREDGLDKSVGVDMLLTAAKTLEDDVGVLPEKS